MASCARLNGFGLFGHLSKPVDSGRQMLRGQMGISQGHGQIRVPKQLPDGIEVHASHHQTACEVVAEVMEAEVTDRGSLEQVGPGRLNVVHSEHAPRVSCLVLPLLQDSCRLSIERDVPLFAALSGLSPDATSPRFQ